MLFVERFSFSLTKYDWSTLRQWTKLTRIDWWTRNDSVFFFFQYSIDLYAGAFVCAWRRLVDHWMEWEGKLVLVKKEKWERIMKMFVKVYVCVCARARIHIHRRFFSPLLSSSRMHFEIPLKKWERLTQDERENINWTWGNDWNPFQSIEQLIWWDIRFSSESSHWLLFLSTATFDLFV